MNLRLASTFTDSLAGLAGDEQKAVKATAFDLQVNSDSPGLSFHKLDRARDKRFWSVRVSQDIRIIVHKDGDSLLLCYVDHHDKAYAWAERRKLEVHPTTGAAQLVEVREKVMEVPVITYVPGEAPASPVAARTVADRRGRRAPPERGRSRWLFTGLFTMPGVSRVPSLAQHFPSSGIAPSHA
jgi:mRNA-degrading endonuclease RelE of RelBE toxin-antitoxin system